MSTNSHAVHPNDPLPPHLDPRGRHRGKRSAGGSGKRAGAARVVLSLGTLLSVALLVLAGYTFYTYRSINNGVTRLDIGGSGSGNTGNSTNDAQSKAKFNGKDQNILLTGNDDRTNMTSAERHKLHTGADGGSMNTDTMMILHLPADGKQATLISLPRDSYVHIDGEGMNRLNSAYPYGYANDAPSGASVNEKRQAGAQLLIKTVHQLTGLTINHYVQVSLLGFYEISNAIGGVPIDLCKAVNDTKAANQSAGLSGGSGLKLSAGKHTISGVTALEFVRQRHFLAAGDLARVKRQQYFLTAAFRKIAGPSIITELGALGSAIKRNIYIDGGLNLTELGLQLESLSANNIKGHTIPTLATMINGQDVLEVSQSKVRAFVDKVLNPPAPTTSPSAPTSKSSTSGSTPASPSASKTKAIDAKCIY